MIQENKKSAANLLLPIGEARLTDWQARTGAIPKRVRTCESADVAMRRARETRDRRLAAAAAAALSWSSEETSP
ncbi:unnamed protein product [Sphagnum balticum]